MSSTTAVRSIEVLRQLFRAYGISEQLISDNDTLLVSKEFVMFMKQNGIKHLYMVCLL